MSCSVEHFLSGPKPSVLPETGEKPPTNELEKTTEIPPPVILPSPSASPTAEEVKKTCASSAPSTLVHNVVFPDPGVECEWGKNGNGLKANVYFQARREQLDSITLPRGAVLCGMSAAAVSNKMRYDDAIMLVMNDVVLSSSSSFQVSSNPLVQSPALKTNTEGLVIYDWKGIFDTNQTHSVDPLFPGINLGVSSSYIPETTYCLGNGNCVWPKTETTGAMNLQFSKDGVYALAARIAGNSQLDLKLITLGDDNYSDCQHNDLPITLRIDYVVP